MNITIKVEGQEKIFSKLKQIEKDLPRYADAAGLEVSRTILQEQGLRAYPPATDANRPPTPYYIRGRGMQREKQTQWGKLSYNDGKSEQLGKQWTTAPFGNFGVKIQNAVSYAKWVHGQMQAAAMARIGWRKLEEVADEKKDEAAEIFAKWVKKVIADLKL